MKTKPIANVRLGRIRAAIWQNETKVGIRYSVTFSRLYKAEDGKWADSTSFNRDDLLILAQVAELAFTTLHQNLGDDSGTDEAEAGAKE